MRSADIEIGGEYAHMRLGVPDRVRVLAKGLPGTGFGSTQRHDGLRVEVIAGGQIGATLRVTSRELAPWTEDHTRRLARYEQQHQLQNRLHRIADRLGIGVTIYGRARGATVSVFSEDFIELAEKLGVETD